MTAPRTDFDTLYSCAAPCRPLWSLCDIAEPTVVWQPANGVRHLGFEDGLVVQVSGPQRFEEARDQCSKILRRLDCRSVDGSSTPTPRMTGGFSFASPLYELSPWRALGEGRLVLPRVSYVNDGENAWVQVLSRADARTDAEAEARRIVQKIDGLSPEHQGKTSGSWECALEVDDYDRECFQRQVSQILKHIHSRALNKAVAWRALSARMSSPPALRALLQRLDVNSANTTLFLIRSRGVAFLGLSPEILVEKVGRLVSSDALAGTAGPAVDEQEALFRSEKERQEHQYVVEAIVQTLSKHCHDVHAPSAPTFRRLRHVQHLFSPIRGTLRNATHVLDLVGSLHPTPAVGGWPRSVAEELVLADPRLDRGWYTGPFGSLDRGGDGKFVVALRSALTAANRAWFYAGAGIVGESQWENEYQETALKLQSMLEVFGYHPAEAQTFLPGQTAHRIYA